MNRKILIRLNIEESKTFDVKLENLELIKEYVGLRLFFITEYKGYDLTPKGYISRTRILAQKEHATKVISNPEFAAERLRTRFINRLEKEFKSLLEL